jgi:hypothetical protein
VHERSRRRTMMPTQQRQGNSVTSKRNQIACSNVKG